jgi:regulatory protein
MSYNELMEHTITSIVQNKRSEHKVNIYLNDEYWLKLDKNKLLEFQLSKGKLLSPEEKSQIEQEATSEKLLDKVLRFISVRPRSVYEVRTYLKLKRQMDDSEINQVVDMLISKNYLSDGKFAEWFVSNRLGSGFHGKNKIKAELIKKGVPSEIINEVLKLQTASEEYQESEDEKIREFIKKALRTIDLSDKQKAKQKIYLRLLARGYEYEKVKKLTNEILS